MEEEEKKYTDKANVEDYLRRELTSREESLLEPFIIAASSVIDSYTGRSWLDIGEEVPEEIGDDDVVERIYDGNGADELFVDDFISVSKIEILDSQGSVYNTYENAEDETDQYFFYPDRTQVKNSIRLRSGRFAHGDARVRVTGYFSSGKLPKAVQVAASSIVARMITNSKGDSSEFEAESIEGYSYKRKKNSEDVFDLSKTEKLLLNKYVKINF